MTLISQRTSRSCNFQTRLVGVVMCMSLRLEMRWDAMTGELWLRMRRGGSNRGREVSLTILANTLLHWWGFQYYQMFEDYRLLSNSNQRRCDCCQPDVGRSQFPSTRACQDKYVCRGWAGISSLSAEDNISIHLGDGCDAAKASSHAAHT